MNESKRYERVDLPFYHDRVAPILPSRVLDFHAHVWRNCDWKKTPWKSGDAGGKYMVTEPNYPVERLLADGKRVAPDRPYQAVCFGYPTPAADLEATNHYAAEAGAKQELFPLMIVGRGTHATDRIEEELHRGGFYGYKVLLNWYGDDYGDIRVEDMIGPEEMRIADRLRLVVLLHVPRAGRLADPEVQAGVRRLSLEYPGANIVLAHCGRCYLPDQMKAAVESIADLANVYVDTSMVMEPQVFQILFDHIPSSRVLFGTDFPVAAMRGRRVYAMDHWVDLVLEGYAPSAYRVAADNIRATFMAWEIMLAVRRGGEMAGVSSEAIRRVFHDNGREVLDRTLGVESA